MFCGSITVQKVYRVKCIICLNVATAYRSQLTTIRIAAGSSYIDENSLGADCDTAVYESGYYVFYSSIDFWLVPGFSAFSMSSQHPWISQWVTARSRVQYHISTYYIPKCPVILELLTYFCYMSVQRYLVEFNKVFDDFRMFLDNICLWLYKCQYWKYDLYEGSSMLLPIQPFHTFGA